MAKKANPVQKAKVFFLTYGCTFNLADTDALKAEVAKTFGLAESEDDADVVVLNTCSVKDSTQERILNKARQLARKGKKLVITGCLAQVTPELVGKAVPEASIIGVWSNAKIAEAIAGAARGNRTVRTKKTKTLPFNVSVDGVFARVQISRGCLGNCTYCSTKLARGHLQSFPQDDIVAAVGSAVAKGAKEIQLTSQDTACYGFDLEGNEDCRRESLATLLEKICARPGRFRIRVGMGNPEHFEKIKAPLARAMMDGKVYRFLHIPVQSGSDTVLKAMNRRYKAADYGKLVAFFQNKIPDLTVETDIIVGFPLETQKDFQDTLDLMTRTRPAITNISRYSPRPRTPAAGLPQVDRKTVNARSAAATALCRKIGLDDNRRLAGSTQVVLVTEKSGNAYKARMQNYKTVLLKQGPVGAFLKVETKGFGQCYVRGSVCG